MSRRILIASYPFKGTMTALEAAQRIGSTITELLPGAELEMLPLGDGGSGTLDALVKGTGGRYMTARCHDPFEWVVERSWGVLGDGSGAIEAARCVALADIPEERRNPERLTTRGIGDLIVAAIDAGVRRLLVGLGDTATHDCGLGVGAVLGYEFLNEDGIELPAIGASLEDLHTIVPPPDGSRLHGLDVVALCDVSNMLTGPDGAALRFSGQKGADDEMRNMLEEGSKNFARIVLRDLGVDVSQIPGGGAAGGLGAGLAAFCGATLVGGAEYLLDTIDFDARLRGCDLVVTGEGRVDEKTLLGKGVMQIARRATESGIPCLVVCGAVEGEKTELESRLGAEIVELADVASASLLRGTRP